MAKTLEEGERISLTVLDVRILSTLIVGKMTGYEIMRKCEKDIQSDNKISNGTLYPALKRLKNHCFIDIISTNHTQRTARLSYIYQITSSGLMVLGWEVNKLQKIIKLAQDRLRDAGEQP